MARILVTGGAGFIGSHLVDRLLEAGHEVTVLDNLFTGRRVNLNAHRNNSNFEFVRHDLIEPVLLEVDQVYHLACPASPVYYQYNPVKTIKTNVLGTIHMLGLAKRVKARFLLASTSEVYGDPLQHPQREDYWGNVNPIGPRSCYDEGKRVAETLTMSYCEQCHVDTRIVRIFNTYGPRMQLNDGRVVSNFIVQALKNAPITIYGDGTQTRSFCYVDDLVRGMIAVMDTPKLHQPINLGNPNELQIGELAKLIIELTNSSSTLVTQKLPQDDPLRRKPDISRAESAIKFKPTIVLREGLKKTISDFESRLKRGES